MEKNDFNVTESLPTILLDSATVHLSISADFTCPVGKVVRGSECVACAPGNALDTDLYFYTSRVRGGFPARNVSLEATETLGKKNAAD